MKIIALGGGGFYGSPNALYLSKRDHDVVIVNDLSRRKIDVELEKESLMPIRPLGERLATWKELIGNMIGFHDFTIVENYLSLISTKSLISKELSIRDLETVREWREAYI